MGLNTKDICNKAFIAVNVIVFLALDITGDTRDAWYMYEHGAMYPQAVIEGGEWYRLVSCMFLHFGIEHLMNNMLLLYFLGGTLERTIGHVKYVLLYLLSGLCGGLFSMYMMLRTQDYAVSGGASGAIYGVIGALVYIVLRNHGRLEELTAKRLVFMVVLTLYYGFASSGVDNFAHLGGLAGGFVLAVLLYRKKEEDVKGTPLPPSP